MVQIFGHVPVRSRAVAIGMVLEDKGRTGVYCPYIQWYLVFLGAVFPSGYPLDFLRLDREPGFRKTESLLAEGRINGPVGRL